MLSAGFCIGASTVGYVLLEKRGEETVVLATGAEPHEGNPQQVFNKVYNSLGKKPDFIGVTGRKLRHSLGLPSLSEPEAVEYAYAFVKAKGCRADIIASAGGENFMVYKLDSGGRITDVISGSKCASGTGEFFLQQLKRLNLEVEEAIVLAEGEEPYPVSGRCSVFCKSDCTHALNKGASKGAIVAGLCKMMAEKIFELLGKTNYESPLLVGGTTLNRAMVDFLKEKVSSLQIPAFAINFEALGAALWAMAAAKKPIEAAGKKEFSFSLLSPLSNYLSRVEFKEIKRGEAHGGDTCLLGLDVGSTTTKAVLVREKDMALLAACYLRTKGDPVGAARDCYREISKQISTNVLITALGVTGSGRQIAGLHALTPAVFNEIIAHAAAAVYFNPDVDTIFELGGQDAKYTLISHGAAVDYAMNEACSAGTGSFLEESCFESLKLKTEDIADIAFKSSSPPNFSDQCAAFINSDIKTAIQEGFSREDIAAGLVYSVCLNYINRVKGSRSVGRKVFMQGGVCYNRAVPTAMAALTGNEIVVPPEPGLMGAFGAVLEVKKRIELGLVERSLFHLDELADREVAAGKSFICRGGKEKCDRKCEIKRLYIKGKVFPFGGACSKYTRFLPQKESTAGAVNYVKVRGELLYKKYGCDRSERIPAAAARVGVNLLLMTTALYPLYYNFFTALGLEVVTADSPAKAGLDRKGAPFCHPVELAHEYLAGLIDKDPDYYFLPQVKSLPAGKGDLTGVTCPFVQGEPYYLTAAFKELPKAKVLSPLLDMSGGYADARRAFEEMGLKMGFAASRVRIAFDSAVKAQTDYHEESRRLGREILAELEEHPEKTAVVLFGRPYNAFFEPGNMGIPHKLASQGYTVIPYEFLPLAEEEGYPGMYWAVGQNMLRGARLVQKHPQLFGVYVTNFSCGPDSFLVTYFRGIMGSKPSLTLELDSHSADAGIDTRVEAFLDIVRNYRRDSRVEPASDAFVPARVEMSSGKVCVKSFLGDFPLGHNKVRLIIPAMGGAGADLLGAVFRYMGVKTEALPPPGEKEFKLGQSFASGKECLPLILTLGSLMGYLEQNGGTEELLVYFMPETSGPCRFGQYNLLMKEFVKERKLQNVAFLSLNSANNYAGLGLKAGLRAWQAVVINDVLEEILSALLTLAQDREGALKIFKQATRQIIRGLEREPWPELKKTLTRAAAELRAIKLAASLKKTAKVALIGEIYVRQDGFSRKKLVERLASRGIMVKTAPVAEWLYYCDFLAREGITLTPALKNKVIGFVQGQVKVYFEREIKKILAASGLYEYQLLDVEELLGEAAAHISPRLTGEAILTVGAALTEIIERAAGVIAIGPFGCMPGRLAEAIINKRLNEPEPLDGIKNRILARTNLPFLSLEADGNPFTPVIEAKLEAFCLQVKRMHGIIKEERQPER